MEGTQQATDWSRFLPQILTGLFTLGGVTITLAATYLRDRKKERAQREALLIGLAAEVEALAAELFLNVIGVVDFYKKHRQLPEDADRAMIDTPRTIFLANAGAIGSLGDYDLVGDLIALHAEVETLDTLARTRKLAPRSYETGQNPILVEVSTFRQEAYAAHLYAAAGIAHGLLEKFKRERQKLGARAAAQEQELNQLAGRYEEAALTLKEALDRVRSKL